MTDTILLPRKTTHDTFGIDMPIGMHEKSPIPWTTESEWNADHQYCVRLTEQVQDSHTEAG